MLLQIERNLIQKFQVGAKLKIKWTQSREPKFQVSMQPQINNFPIQASWCFIGSIYEILDI